MSMGVVNQGWLIVATVNGCDFWVTKDGLPTDIKENAKVFPMAIMAKLEAAKQSKEFGSRFDWMIESVSHSGRLRVDFNDNSRIGNAVKRGLISDSTMPNVFYYPDKLTE